MENIGLIYKKRETFTEIGQGSGSLPPAKRKRILKKVAIIHLALIVIPLIWYGISYFFLSQRPSVIKVTLVSAPPPDSSDSDIPEYTPPRETPKDTGQPPPTNPTKPTKPKWKPKKSNEITISKKVIKNNSQKPAKNVSANDIEAKLRKIYSNNSNAAPVSSNQGNISASYRDKLYTAIYESWNQPARSELGGKYPVVDITLTVESNGRISSSRISQKSGLGAMDLSVKRLLGSLKKLPKPPSGRMTFTVSLEIVD